MTESWEHTFRANMRRLRQQQGLSQEDLGNLIRARGPAFGQQVVARIEKGQRPLRLDEGFIIADVLGSTVEEMASDAELAEAEAIRRRYREARDRLMSAIREVDTASRDAEQFLQVSDAKHPALHDIAQEDAWYVHRQTDEIDEHFDVVSD